MGDIENLRAGDGEMWKLLERSCLKSCIEFIIIFIH